MLTPNTIYMISITPNMYVSIRRISYILTMDSEKEGFIENKGVCGASRMLQDGLQTFSLWVLICCSPE